MDRALRFQAVAFGLVREVVTTGKPTAVFWSLGLEECGLGDVDDRSVYDIAPFWVSLAIEVLVDGTSSGVV